MSEQRPGTAAEGEAEAPRPAVSPSQTGAAQPPGEVDGPKGPEPTRYGDWETGGRCSDF